MKEMLVIIRNENGKLISDEMIKVLLTEIPMVGDYVFLNDEENISSNDQTSYLNLFCIMTLPEEETPGFQFKVVSRTIFRVNGKSWVCVELQHEHIEENEE